MSSLTVSLAFGGVVLLGAMSPGPDFAVVVRRSALSGRGPGMAAALGIAAGVSAWVVAAATGIAALLAASALAFTVVKVAGAAYLGYLGTRALLSAARGDGPTRPTAPARANQENPTPASAPGTPIQPPTANDTTPPPQPPPPNPLPPPATPSQPSPPKVPPRLSVSGASPSDVPPRLSPPDTPSGSSRSGVPPGTLPGSSRSGVPPRLSASGSSPSGVPPGLSLPGAPSRVSRSGGPLRLGSLAVGWQGGWAAFGEGLLTNVLNPKAALFFVALVPQFLAGGADALSLALIALGGTVVWFLVVANVVSALRAFFARPAVRRTLDAVTGIALIALGVRLATATRP